MKKNQFVFVIVDQGIIQYLAVEENAKKIKDQMAKHLRSYLDENSEYTVKEHATEDGYANLFEVLPTGNYDYVLSYPFDGEETVESALERLSKKLNL